MSEICEICGLPLLRTEEKSEIEFAKGQRPGMFEYQAPAILNQAAPIQNTWYTLLDTTPNARIYGIGVNIEDANETLELRITVDSQILLSTKAATHSTTYTIKNEYNAVTRTVVLIADTNQSQLALGITFICEGHSVKIEIRKTTATGAGNLMGVVSYGVKKGS
jgi:hypothetical protein